MNSTKYWTVLANGYAWLAKLAAHDLSNGQPVAHVRAFYAVKEAEAIGHLHEARQA